jgi:hypothetical protein
MPSIVLVDTSQISLFIPTNKYALQINGRYWEIQIFSTQFSTPCILMENSERFKYFSTQFSMPCILMEDKWQNYFFNPTIQYALYIPGRNVKDILIYTHNYVRPVYSWHIRDSLTYWSQQLSTPYIFLGDKRQIFLSIPTIRNALYIPGRYVTDLLISPHNSVCPECSLQIRNRFN